MANDIHPTAVIDPGAELGDGIVIGPYCVIGAGVKLGDGCRLQNHVTLAGPSEIVIIADADRNLRNVLRQHFTDLGFYPILAADGAEGGGAGLTPRPRRTAVVGLFLWRLRATLNK